MVAEKRPDIPRYGSQARFLLLAGLSFLLAISGCDLLSTAFPQGYADDLVSYADPRWEDRVRIEDSQFFGLALENSGPSPRIFVIGRTAVAEYDADLKPVRRYLPSNVLNLEAYTKGHGPEKWYAQYMTSPAPVLRLYGAWSGCTIYLFESGGTAYVKNSGNGPKPYSSFMPYAITVDFDLLEENFVYDSGNAAFNWDTGGTSFGSIINPGALHFDAYSDQVHILTVSGVSPAGPGRASYTVVDNVFARMGTAAASGFSVPLRTPALSDEFSPDRFFTDGNRTAVQYSNNSSEFGWYRSAVFLYDRFGSEQPLAGFWSNSAAVESTADALYVLAATREGEAWLHRLRWLP